MSKEIRELNIDELNAVSGGATIVSGANNVASAGSNQVVDARKAGGEHVEYLRYAFKLCMSSY